MRETLILEEFYYYDIHQAPLAEFIEIANTFGEKTQRFSPELTKVQDSKLCHASR
jgi:hypothetical protein